MYRRRDVLKLAAAGMTLPAGSFLFPGAASAQTAVDTAASQLSSGPFDPAKVVDLARAMSKQPQRKLSLDLPDSVQNLSFEQYASIRRVPETNIWANIKTGFAIEPLHRGFIFNSPMQLFAVEDGSVQRINYDPTEFSFGKITPPTAPKDFGFAGFRILQTGSEGIREAAVFYSAGFYQTIARGQTPGVAARGLSIRTADTQKEEFPNFVAAWIERPVLAANLVVIHGLLDSESVTGAYRFTFRPGEMTIVDTECTLFPRVAIDHYGLGTMQGTYLYGPIERRRSDDVRPGVYDVSGLAMLSGQNEWIYRPVANRQNLQVSAFVDENPRGFGFLQRDRDFASFMDDDQHWEQRPSLWIEPIGDWGPGWVTLLEIPAESQTNQNIVAYWRSRAGLVAGTEPAFAYRQFWCWTPPNRPPYAVASKSRSGRTPGAPANAKRRRFQIEFTGDILGDETQSPDVTPKASAATGSIVAVRFVLARSQKAMRVTLDVDAGNDASCELRLLLESGGKPVSETWLFRWTP
jgi:glucans biosynthesis protein